MQMPHKTYENYQNNQHLFDCSQQSHDFQPMIAEKEDQAIHYVQPLFQNYHYANVRPKSKRTKINSFKQRRIKFIFIQCENTENPQIDQSLFHLIFWDDIKQAIIKIQAKDLQMNHKSKTVTIRKDSDLGKCRSRALQFSKSLRTYCYYFFANQCDQRQQAQQRKNQKYQADYQKQYKLRKDRWFQENFANFERPIEWALEKKIGQPERNQKIKRAFKMQSYELNSHSDYLKGLQQAYDLDQARILKEYHEQQALNQMKRLKRAEKNRRKKEKLKMYKKKAVIQKEKPQNSTQNQIGIASNDIPGMPQKQEKPLSFTSEQSTISQTYQKFEQSQARMKQQQLILKIETISINQNPLNQKQNSLIEPPLQDHQQLMLFQREREENYLKVRNNFAINELLFTNELSVSFFKALFSETMANIHEQLTKRRPIIQYISEYLQWMLSTTFPNTQYEVYGSTQEKIELPTSDIDIHINFIDSFQAQETFYSISQFISTNSSFFDHQLLQNCSVPVIKFSIDTSSISEAHGLPSYIVDIDLTMEPTEQKNRTRTSGLQSTAFTKDYLNRFPNLRDTMIMLKFLIRKFKLSSSYEGGFNSYCLFVMLIAFIEYFGPELSIEYMESQIIFLRFIEFYVKFYQNNNQIFIHYQKGRPSVYKMTQIVHSFPQFKNVHIKETLKMVCPVSNRIITCSFRQFHQMIQSFKSILLNQYMLLHIVQNNDQKNQKYENYYKKIQRKITKSRSYTQIHDVLQYGK